MAHPARVGDLDRWPSRPPRIGSRHPRRDVRPGVRFGFLWTFKLVRYAPGLAGLQRVVRDSRHALLSVLIGFCIVLVVSASLAYLLERTAQPQSFGSMPAALWWAITTLTTTGYGDVTPVTPLGRMLGGIVMVSGIVVFALWASILATGFAEETRRQQFLQTWDLVAKVPFFTMSALRRLPMSRASYGRANTLPARLSSAAGSQAIACILSFRVRSRFS